jgi:hypothetical protein
MPARFLKPGLGNQDVTTHLEETPYNKFNNNNGPCCYIALTAKETALQEEQEALKNTRDKQTIKRLSRKETLDYYNLIHRRFGHIGLD